MSENRLIIDGHGTQEVVVPPTLIVPRTEVVCTDKKKVIYDSNANLENVVAQQ
jgi:hypothetical protein